MIKKFEFGVNLGKLLEAQESLQQAIGGRETFPILQMVLLEVTDDELILRAFNNHLQIKRVVDIINLGVQDKFCVPVFMFTVLAKYTNKEDDINIIQLEKDGKLLNKLEVSQDKRSNEFSFIDAEQYPDRIVLEDYVYVNMSLLSEAFKLTAIGTDDTADKRAKQCFHLDGEGRLLAGDGSQFTKYEGVNASNSDVILLRAKTILANMKFLTEIGLSSDCEIAFDEKWLGIRSLSAAREIIFQQYTGDPIDVLKIFNLEPLQDSICEVTVVLNDLKDVLELSTVYENQALSASLPQYTTVTIAENGMTFEIRIEDLSSNTEQIDVKKLQGEDFTIQFLSSKLQQMVNELSGEEVVFQFYGKTLPFRVTAVDHIESEIIAGNGEEVLVEYPVFEYLQTP